MVVLRSDLVQQYWEQRAHRLFWQAEIAMERGLPHLAMDLQELGMQILIRVESERAM